MSAPGLYLRYAVNTAMQLCTVYRIFQQGSPQPVVLAGNGTVNVGIDDVCWQPFARHSRTRTPTRYALTWLTLETIKMTSETLKIRAKNLRNAVKSMLHVSVTHAQALELVAKEENYPTWDAACASFRASNTSEVNSDFGHTESDTRICQMLDPSSNLGALIIVWGATGQGKTTTSQAIVNDLLAQPGAVNPMAILHAGFQEFTYPETVVARYIPQGASIIGSGEITESLVVVDELGDSYATFEVIAMVLTGAKVIVTLHSTNSPLDRVRSLLKGQSLGELFLERLLENGQILPIKARR